MNEADTRAELIDPQLKDAGWGEVEESRIQREYPINKGEIRAGGVRAGQLKADYILIYKNIKLAVIEAKSEETEVGEGVSQAKLYGEKLHLDFAFAANGKSIYQISLQDGKEGIVKKFPSPQELWDKKFVNANEWEKKFNAVEFKDIFGEKDTRYYQEIAVNKVLKAIANDQKRILLTMATGTGKTVIAFQIAWKLFHTQWNLQKDGKRLPRILFLADRNILANQAFNTFGAFEENALVRIRPSEIKKKGSVPTNASIFFTIFQTFMSGENNEFYFGQYPPDFFDLIIVDECHRGGANDESRWRGILEYFKPAYQLGLTATPKRDINADTYAYFEEPVYIYSLKEGITDGFLSPFKVRRIQTTMDEYVYSPEDEVVEGEVEEGKLYIENEFNRIIEIEAREKKRVKLILQNINPNDKTIVFCASQAHAANVRDLINQLSPNKDTNYCVRVTANDGEIGETHLRTFQDNEKTIPTILTTSRKLSTGVDALNIRNIVLMRPINTMIEFKQIIGRGTRLFEGKHYFTIIDFVNAYQHFQDPDWDGEPVEPDDPSPSGATDRPPSPDGAEEEPTEPTREKIKIKLSDGKEREIKSTSSNYFYVDGKPISSEEFLKKIFNTLSLPDLFKNEEELRKLWSSPITRKEFLNKLEQKGFLKQDLMMVQKLINAENSDLFDVLEYISYAKKPISRNVRVENAKDKIFTNVNEEQKDFINFILEQYIKTGVDELAINNLSNLIKLKYQSIFDGQKVLGNLEQIQKTFIDFQKHLYLEARV